MDFEVKTRGDINSFSPPLVALWLSQHRCWGTSLLWAKGELLVLFHLFLLGVLKLSSEGAHSLFSPSALPSSPAREAPQGEKSQRTHFSAVAQGSFHTHRQDRNVQQSEAICLHHSQGCSAPHHSDHLEWRGLNRARLSSQAFRRWHSQVQ